jgi:hypothetical protein
MNNWSQDFTVKSNARRAARKAGVDPAKVAAFVKAGKTLFRFPMAEAPKAAKRKDSNGLRRMGAEDKAAKATARMKKVQAATAARVAKGLAEKAKKPAQPAKARPNKPKHADAAEAVRASGARGGKFAQVALLLRRPGGASMPEVTGITGWKPHSARARISVDVSKLLAKGEEIVRTRADGVSVYAIVKSKQLDLPIPDAA